ncbi:hypothetical protein MHM98_04765 [Psychrobium sp. MM17-31]|uniref:hypothetical protein n=1 Tax=Psychrobium sp. MM17-31 TaxID=2917758 RepID=UPI001EF5C158|nr:hypothetical protein [Psychrobium sp. MM17-31]MCG7530669.1 hypothetical protein [Psychrobium sp. MM17-31]
MKNVLVISILLAICVPLSFKGYALYSLHKNIKNSGIVISTLKLREFELPVYETELPSKPMTVFALNFSISTEFSIHDNQDFITPNRVLLTNANQVKNKSLLITRNTTQRSYSEYLKKNVSADKLLNLFGQGNLNSDYALRKHLYSINLNELSLMSDLETYKLANIAILTRTMDTSRSKHLFSYHLPNINLNIFQFGSPHDDQEVYVELHNQNHLYTLKFRGFKQSDIDLLLTSLKLNYSKH